ncbi:hypothetical protein [Streptomyces sp. H34-S4]|uniref:hypothetical protein n=1 Tax=Streptomyces sp. H34-S4 TaxID=2996463 RepID=UPI002270F503|nr:hypothetical protein [Streptomyces sp. H34-S4]MCY0939253.1 hypothetical protein [Streptomyces sp. H34-S4]
MNIPFPHPLHVLDIASRYAVTEQQAEVAITWAAVDTVCMWEDYARANGLDESDGDVMETWGAKRTPEDHRAVLDTAIANITNGAHIVLDPVDELLCEVRRTVAPASTRLTRPMRTNRPRIR